MSSTRSILVLGMHRSGTSALARVLGLMGADLGEADELLPAHSSDNPTGYWERTELNEIHDDMLAAAGHSWDRVAGLEPHALDAEAEEACSLRLKRLIDRLDATGRPWLAKDPRLCLLLSQWLPILKGDAAFVIVVRDPREIAASLTAGPRGTFTSQFVIALWEKYLRTLLTDLADRRALFVSYEALLEKPRAQSSRLSRGLTELGVRDLHEAEEAKPSGFLDVRLRRSRPRAHDQLSSTQESLQYWLEAQCAADGPVLVAGFPQAPAPDAVLAEFEAAFDYHIAHGRWQAGAEAAKRLDRIEAALAQQTVERERATAQHAEERAKWLADSAAQRQQFSQAQREQDLAASSAQKHAADLEDRIAQFQRHAEALDASVRALRTSLSWRITAPLRGVAGLLRLPANFKAEQRLYRLYYAMPGLSAARKRALVVWLHRHVPWLTRNTLSFQFYTDSETFLSRHVLTPEEQERMERMDAPRAAALLETLPRKPLISIVMPVYNVERRWLAAAVSSVRRQFYPNWELCIADDASTRTETRQALDELAAENDPRVKIIRLKSNSGIGLASNAAFDLATGEFVGLLDHDDELTLDALLEVVREINEHDPDLIYSDEDKTDEDNVRKNPFFKPDFSPEYFFSNNYLCHFTVLRTSILKQIGGFREGVDGAQDFDLFLRFTEHTQRVAHIPKVLYHWRMIAGSTAAVASAKPYTWEAGRLALEHTLQNRRLAAHAERGPFPNTYRVRYDIKGEPLVSILIPFRDKPELLRVCIGSILKKTGYANYEIIGIDNSSAQAETHNLMKELEKHDRRVRFVRYDAPFNFSAINNFGARQTRGEHLLLLNNDTEVISDEWLQAMLEHSQREEVGVVGAHLLYPDDTVQHAGVVIDRHVVAMHPFQYLPAQHPGYAALPHLLHNVSAVTFACAMTRRSVFEQLGGLDETQLAVCYNDVDYCLRAREAGYVIVYTPYAVLHHFESKSRGIDDHLARETRFRNELAFMQQRHAGILRAGDPYYNPNLSLGVQGGYHADTTYADKLPL